MKRKNAWTEVITAAMCLVFAASANAQITNPDFNGGLSGWESDLAVDLEPSGRRTISVHTAALIVTNLSR